MAPSSINQFSSQTGFQPSEHQTPQSARTGLDDEKPLALSGVPSSSLGTLGSSSCQLTVYQAVVNQLIRAIHASTDVHQVLQLATERTVQALGVQQGMVLRFKYGDPLVRDRRSETPARIRVTLSHAWQHTPTPAQDSIQTYPLELIPGSSFWLSDCSFCQQALTQVPTPLAIADWQPANTGNSTSQTTAPFISDSMPALLICPLQSQGTTLGFLVFQANQPRIWQAEELEFVELVSAQISTAIIQAETLRQVQTLVEKRTAELQQSLAVQAKLYERTRQQVSQLQRLNQLKDEFLSTVSHELRTPLTSMALAIRMLRQAGADRDRSARYLDILEQQCAQETSLINDLLALQELDLKQVPLQLQPINLIEVVQSLTAPFEQKWSMKGLGLNLTLPEYPVSLQSDRDSLNRILLELLTNAGKYAAPHSTVQIDISHSPPDALQPHIVFMLRNLGAGIPPEELPYIFDRFRRCADATQNAVQGTGLGLALVQCLVHHLSGTISAASQAIADTESWETCFTLTLPHLPHAHSGC